jgi:hypothetical protein
MNYDWYKIANISDLDVAEIDYPSMNYSLILEDVGLVDVMMVKGANYGLIYDDVFLSANMNGENPFAFDGYAIYQDDDDYLWLGIEVEDEE